MPRRTPHDDPRLVEARRIARGQGDVLARPQLYELDITTWEIRGEVRAGRWQLVGDQSVCVHKDRLDAIGERWAAVFQGGPRAQLDGASSLIARGLERSDDGRVRVSVPRGARVRRNQRFDIRQTRRWSAGDLV